MRERVRESHMDADTEKDIGNKYVRQKEFLLNHRCTMQRVRLANEREHESRA